jgi:hypothetical protein
VKEPVFSFEAELLTDAPFNRIAERLNALASPSGFRSLQPLLTWLPMEGGAEVLHLRWERVRWGALEQGGLIIRPDARGAHLRLEGRMRGWAGFLLFGIMRWKTDRLLDRFVEEL